MQRFYRLVISVLVGSAFCGTGLLHAQSSNMVSEAELLCMKAEDYVAACDFSKAITAYEDAQDVCRDSLKNIAIGELIVQCENAQSMMPYCSKPRVIAREKFSLQDFYLYYPLEDKTWHQTGDSLNLLFHSGKGADKVVLSVPDTLGVLNLCQTEWTDTVWSQPQLLSTTVTSARDESFPLRDGDKLYFSSKGLYGMGGYDLYVSTLDPLSGEWSEPENLGFPFSSPADDFLFMNTPDGKYTIFASNRDCSADSVYIYVLEYETMPVRSAVRNAAELKALITLLPESSTARIDNTAAISEAVQEDAQTARYSSKMAQVRSLRDSVAFLSEDLKGMRIRYSSSSDASERAELSGRIMNLEMDMLGMQSKADKAARELQAIEMEFLLNGVVIDRSVVEAESDKELIGTGSGYTFTKKTMGAVMPLWPKITATEPSEDGIDGADGGALGDS